MHICRFFPCSPGNATVMVGACILHKKCAGKSCGRNITNCIEVIALLFIPFLWLLILFEFTTISGEMCSLIGACRLNLVILGQMV